MGYPVHEGVFQRASRSRGSGEFRSKFLMPVFHIIKDRRPVLTVGNHLLIMDGIRERLIQTGRMLEDRLFGNPGEVAELCRTRRVSGLLVVQGLPYNWVKQLCSLAPVIMINPRDHYPELGIDSVMGNETRAAALILDCLSRKGHRQIAWFGLWDKQEVTEDFARGIDPLRTSDRCLFSSALRYGSWAELALFRPDGKTMPMLILERDWKTQSLNDVISRGLDQLMAIRPVPTAIVVTSEPMAEELISVAAARGIRVPEDLSVVCYGDGVASGPKGVATIVAPHRLLGRAALELLERRLAMPEAVPVTMQIECKLRGEKSIGAPSG